MKKILDFFKTPFGIILAVVAVIVIALITMNWTKIKTWFSPNTERKSCPPDTYPWRDGFNTLHCSPKNQ